ncbi:hypothetical protein CBF34_06370 [Vagococcus penaei]|uniref:Competence protein CoiA n=1 Tax=Vagococcus penaei TaxID=633807 RepID=A0A1Q2D6Y7_9ENTE|nr:competence protein CoiA family protein [Vagococcus penaei]AQP54158.1 hypothetical protein BW732_07950 [Vagococcus penaei]RSU02157.1 hypothetical protein CBF34_06370 [Vagococcus penaei]
MLLGKGQDGELVDLTQMKKKDIELLRDKKWYCCCCGSLLCLKNGSQLMSHFAHKSKQHCDSFAESESQEHLTGKAIIAQNCRHYQHEYQLEAYLPTLNQRPDVLIVPKIAIEFQCSQLALSRFIERSQTYQRHGYYVCWLLGRELFVRRPLKKLSTLQIHCLRLSNTLGFYLWGVDVLTLELKLVYYIRYCHGHLTYQEASWSLKEESLVSLLKAPHLNYLLLKTTHGPLGDACYRRTNWNQRLTKKESSIMVLQAYFYERGLNLRTLPNYLMVPDLTHVIFGETELIIRYESLVYMRRVGKGTVAQLVTSLMSLPLIRQVANQATLIQPYRLLEQVVMSYCLILGQQDMIQYQESQATWEYLGE